ncbi:hypothetical protein [Salmonirosea aquatica]|uniref:Uncharacterized protein n=1 Tax=Salmonirosea aquatica TaxID=2654236 RepID=A0A7C9BKJ6_9BACT|nr:hypothetical protein [Cytophagaceae bacterium SJW1-29]
MKELMKRTILLLLTCMACSKRHTIKASMNDARWYGTGEAIEIHTKENMTCSTDRFSLIARTDGPFSKQDSSVTQILSFYHIPLEKGTYDLALPDTCLPVKIARSTTTFTVSRASFHVLDTQTRKLQRYYEFTDGDQGWVKVMKLNRTAGKIKGRFEVSLTGIKGQKIRFKRGKFNSLLRTQ